MSWQDQLKADPLPWLLDANAPGVRYHWGLRRGQEIEKWGDGIRLLDGWGYLDRPEPRLDHIRWIRHIPLLARVMRVYHFQLGEAAG